MVAAMPDLDGDGIPNIPSDYKYPQQRIDPAGWYMAEGSTGGGMQTYVLVQNPTDEDVSVNLSFQTDSGRVVPDDLQGVTVPAKSRRTFPLGMWVTTYDVSTVAVEPVQGEIVCERAMYEGGGAWATDSIGTTAPSAEWYLAEGCTDGGMQTYVLVQNPNREDVHVDLTFNTGTDEISPAELQGVLIPAGTRQTYLVNNWVTSYDVSTCVECADGAVVVERAMYGGGGAWATDFHRGDCTRG